MAVAWQSAASALPACSAAQRRPREDPHTAQQGNHCVNTACFGAIVVDRRRVILTSPNQSNHTGASLQRKYQICAAQIRTHLLSTSPCQLHNRKRPGYRQIRLQSEQIRLAERTRRMTAVSRCSSAAMASTPAAADSSSLSSASSRCRRSAAAARLSRALQTVTILCDAATANTGSLASRSTAAYAQAAWPQRCTSRQLFVDCMIGIVSHAALLHDSLQCPGMFAFQHLLHSAPRLPGASIRFDHR